MSLEPGRRSVSPESSGRDSPAPRQWRNQLGADDTPKDKHFRKYAAGVERALALFDTALQEWADYISFLNRLLKALQARPSNQKVIPAKSLVSKRLSQCLNPSLPSGVHQKTIEVYTYIFSVIGTDGLTRDLPLYLPGLAPTLSFASLSVRAPFLDLLEKYFVELDPRALRPALKSLILALLPGLEEETSEDFERTLKLVERFKRAVRSPGAEEITEIHATGDDFFWQCFFLASITGQGRRPGALAYLVRNLPRLGHQIVHDAHGVRDAEEGPSEASVKLTELVTFPEPGLLLRCFAAGLGDEQLLIQRGFLDLLVTHLPLHSKVLQQRVKGKDLELLLKAAGGVVIRRDMSLNRRLWTWLIGPEPVVEHESGMHSPASEHHLTHKTSYFEEFGLQPLTQAILDLVESSAEASPAERARPYRICLSLMDKWEVGGLVVPEVFLPVVDSVRKYKTKAPSKAEFAEVLRSASVFFDGVESGLIYGVMVGLAVQAMGTGKLSGAERLDKLDLVDFMINHFNVREEEMITIHAPLTALGILCLLENPRDRKRSATPASSADLPKERLLALVAKFMDMVPDRAFPAPEQDDAVNGASHRPSDGLASAHLQKIKDFYMNNQGNLDAAQPPFKPRAVGALILQRATALVCESLLDTEQDSDVGIRSRILMQAALRAKKYKIESAALLEAIHSCLSQPYRLSFTSFSSIVALANNLYSTDRIGPTQLSELVTPLVRHSWSFLASGEPKYHVETVRCLWQLQTALTPFNRDIEAAISALIIKDDVPGTYAVRPADSGRSFCVLWTHTLQDQTHGLDRRAPKTPHHDLRSFPRLAGVDNFDVMLTRPLFLMLDSLLDERTQLFMTVKAWLHTMVGVDRLLEVFVSKFSELPFLQTVSGTGETASYAQAIDFSADDDLDMCLYYLRTLSNVFRWAPDMFWYVLASAHVTIDDGQMHLQRITGSEIDISFQEFFLQVCMRCMAGNNTPSDEQLKLRIAQLQRCALTLLHQILLSPYADKFSGLNVENILIDRLVRALKGPDPYIQVLLLDVVHASLRIRDLTPVEVPATSPSVEKKAMNFDRRGSKQSLAIETPSKPSPPPPSLLKCIQSGFTAPSSRSVLDSWVRFLTECLPLYADSIFQVLIPLVETLCGQIEGAFSELQAVFREPESKLGTAGNSPESTLIYLLNGLEHVLAEGHRQLIAEEARVQSMKSPEQPQSFFGSVVSGVFTTETQQSRSATANDRLTVLLAFQDAVRMCFTIWSWGQGPQEHVQDTSSVASFTYTSLRMRNRARRLLEHLFEAETMECLETVVEIWKSSLMGDASSSSNAAQVLKLLPALDGSRPKHTMPAIFNALYSRTNPGALDPSRKSTLTIELNDMDLVIFLVDYAKSLEDDAMDEIWQDCLIFLKDLLGNPFPHRQILPSLLEFTAVLGEKVDNTNFGEDRKMRRELGDLFLRLLTALFTTRPMTFDSVTTSRALSPRPGDEKPATNPRNPSVRAEDVVGILESIVPNLPTVLIEPDRVITAATTISTNVIAPCFKARAFPDNVTTSILSLLQELAKLPNTNAQKTWKKDVSEAFNDGRFFSSSLNVVKARWLEILRQWTVADSREKLTTEILSRITAPSTAGIVFGVGATSARLEADRRTQLNLRRMGALIMAGPRDGFVTELPAVTDKLVELLSATPTSSPSSATRGDVYLLLRALVLKTNPVHLAPLWPVVNAELHAAISSVVAADHSSAAETHTNAGVLQACKLLDLLVCVAPDDWQLAEWLFVTDTIDSVYRPASQGTESIVALVDELSEVLGSQGAAAGGFGSALQGENAASLAAKSKVRRPLIGIPGGIGEELNGPGSAGMSVLERRDELVARVLRPFFGQLSIYAFESTYAMVPVDLAGCEDMVLRDMFDERGIAKGI